MTSPIHLATIGFEQTCVCILNGHSSPVDYSHKQLAMAKRIFSDYFDWQKVLSDIQGAQPPACDTTSALSVIAALEQTDHDYC